MLEHALKIQADILQSSVFEFFDRAGRNNVEKLAYVPRSYYL